jgi:beta-glucosidase
MVSDFNSIVEMVDHGFARDSKHAAQIAINAGSDMDMESFSYGKYLEQLIEEGEVAKGLVEDAVARVLRVKFELGLFEDPYRYCDLKRQNRLLNHPEHHATALEIAKRSIVLLKNQGPLLPLAKQGMSIAVIGPLADDTNSSLGSWRLAADDYSGTSLFRALSAYEGNSTCYAKGAKLVLGEQKFTEDLHINQTDRTGFAEALAQAKQVDRVILVLGEHGLQSGEARSRADLGLPGLQQELMEKIYQVNQDIVLVLMNGRPLTISWATEHIPAIVEAWQLGSQSGPAIAQVLYGDYNPSGKLPMTFPRSVGQLPVYYYRKKTGRPTKKQGVFWSHSTDESNEPLYCFGYGLSYTQFSYANLVVKQQGPSAFNVQVTVANIGQYDGEEVVQLYLEDVVGSITRPQKQLKAFQKILLKKGESQLVNFKLDREVLGFFNAQGSFVVEPGEFRVWVGTNVSEGLSTTFELYRDDKAKISS